MSVAMMINESDNTDPSVDNRDMKITWAIQGEARNGLGPDMGYLILNDPNALSIDQIAKPLECMVFPNPSNGKTNFQYQLEQPGKVKVQIMDLQGRVLSETISGFQPIGTHQVVFDGSKQAAGTYLYRIQSGSQVAQGQVVILP